MPNPLPKARQKRDALQTHGAVLRFTKGAEKGRELPLVFEKTTLGRKYGDILVRDIRVSSRHLEIELGREKISIRDLGSSNGTFSGGKTLRGRVWVPYGEEISLGDSAFVVERDPTKAALLTSGKVRIYDQGWKGLSDLIRQEFVEADLMGGGGTERMRQSSNAPSWRVGFAVKTVAGETQRFGFTQPLVILGRLDVDLVLHDHDVSRRHASVEVTPSGQCVLRDLASGNGTRVNGVPVSHCLLKVGDRIKLGQTKVIFLGAEKA